ncbi:AEC family transporter [Pseudomaricurvus alkylphenolicus]|uniref:AEC family transporter n=1 Tax=Pseudomaricurvus alkylphenolicus TaxID=1306991 RepID=UPI00141EA1B5|nr:AEC family transporter [Pseudomaricurvus alkylphenolicus]NIB43886.1 AEC family transporter [Pseudomaricurvus alkylphenolicus]
MLNQLFSVIAPILVCTGIGFMWVRRGHRYPADFISRLVMNIGAPCLILSSLGSTELQLGGVLQLLAAASLVLLFTLVVGFLCLRIMNLGIPAHLPPLLFPNCGNVGLPLCLFAFGEAGLALGLVYFVFMMVAHLTLGIVIVRGAEQGLSSAAADIARQPLFFATVLAILFASQQWALPVWASITVELLGNITIPLMLMTLGVSLASLKVNFWHRALILSSVRVLGGVFSAWLICRWMGIDGLERNVIVLQSAMPAAVFNYLFALKYERDPQAVAGLVVASTLLSFILLPFLLSYLLSVS